MSIGTRVTLPGGRNTLVSVFLLMILSACGGGGGGGGSEGDPTDNGDTDNTDDGSPDSGTTNLRVSRVRYDFDNNGVFEGVREFAYGTDGRIMQERYTYSDDGTEDVYLAGTLSNSIGLDPVDETIDYTYDTEGRLQTWVGYNSETRQTSRYSYDDNDLLTRVDVTIEDGTGAVTSQYSHRLTYSGQQLVAHNMTLTGETTPLFENAIVYDDAGYVIENNQTTTQNGIVSHYAYTYLTNARPDTITETVSALPDYRMTFEFGYTGDNQPSYLNFLSEGPGNDNRYSFEEQYDSDGRHVARQVDDLIDGSIDAVAEIEWEEGSCTPVLDWHPRTVTADTVDTRSPYIPGTGYVWLSHCTDGI
jgi:YD repeat-containing protein